MPTFRAKFTPAEKVSFGRQLRKLMTDKGLSGAELARKMSLHMPEGKTVGRDNISWYLSGRSMPTNPALKAMAKVLEISPQFLLPRDPNTRPGEIPAPPLAPENNVRMHMVGNGMMHLQIDKHLPLKVGWEIMQIMKKYDDESAH